jgi:hypothetical protein
VSSVISTTSKVSEKLNNKCKLFYYTLSITFSPFTCTPGIKLTNGITNRNCFHTKLCAQKIRVSEITHSIAEGNGCFKIQNPNPKVQHLSSTHSLLNVKSSHLSAYTMESRSIKLKNFSSKSKTEIHRKKCNMQIYIRTLILHKKRKLQPAYTSEF